MTIRQELELDLTAALAQVDTLATALTDAFTGAGDVIAQSIASAADTITGLDFTITPAVDTAVAVDTITADLDAITATVVPDVDTSILDAGLQASTDQLSLDFAGIDMAPLADAITQGVATANVGEQLTLDLATIDATPLADAVSAAVTEGGQSGLEGIDPSAVTGLGSAASAAGAQASGGFNAAAGSARGFDIAVAGASGSLANSAGSISKLVPGAAIITSLAGAAGALFSKAETAHASFERLNVVFGDDAAAVQKVNIGGLNGALGDLAIKAGSGGSALRQATANFGLFAQGFGAGREQTRLTTEQLQALSLRAVALNPSLGEAGDAMQRLSGALITGRAKALAPFALGLDQTAIKAKATQIALDDGRTTVTALDKVMAGAALATSNLGNKLGTDFAKGIDQSTVKLRSLQKQIATGLVVAGTPLIEPVIKAATDLTPVAIELSKVIGEILGAVVPLVAVLATDLAPGLVAVATSAEHLLTASAPAAAALGAGLGGAATVAADALSGLATIIDAIPSPVVTAAAAFGLLVFAGSKIIPFVGEAILGVTDFTAVTLASVPALEGFGIAANTAGEAVATGMDIALGPIGLVVAGVAALALAFGVFGGKQQSHTQRVAEATTALYGEAKAHTAVSTAVGTEAVAIAKANDSLVDFLAHSKQSFLSGDDEAKKLKTAGIGYDQVAAAVRGGDAATAALNRRVVESSGAWKNMDASQRTAVGGLAGFTSLITATGGRWDNLTAAQKRAFDSLGPGVQDLIDSLSAEEKQQIELAKASIDSNVAVGNFTKGQVAAAEQQTRNADGTKNYVAALAALNVEAEKAAAKQAALAAAASNAAAQSTGAFTDLQHAILAGGDITALSADFAANFGVDAKAVDAFAKSVSASLDGIVSAVSGTLPATGDAIKSFQSGITDAYKQLATAEANKKSSTKEIAADKVALENATDPRRIIENLNKEREAINTFNTNVAKLFASGNTRAAQEALKLGPEVGGAFAQSLIKGGSGIEAAANTSLLGVDAAQSKLLSDTKTRYGPAIVNAFGQIGKDASGNLVLTMDSGTTGAVATNIAHIIQTFGANSSQLRDAAALAGETLSQAYQQALDLEGPTAFAMQVVVPAIQAADPTISAAAAGAAADLASAWGINLASIPTATSVAYARAAQAVIRQSPHLSAASAVTAIESVRSFSEQFGGIPDAGAFGFAEVVRRVRAATPGLSVASARAAVLAAAAFDHGASTLPTSIKHHFDDAIDRANDAAQGKKGQTTAAGKAIGDAITAGLKSSIPGSSAAAQAAGSDVSNKFSASFATGIQKGGKTIGDQTETTINNHLGARQAKNAATAAGTGVGGAFTAGLVSGIQAGIPNLTNAAAAAIVAAEQAAKRKAGIQSPSRLFHEIGIQISAGLAQGITSAGALSVSAVTSLVEQIAHKAADTGAHNAAAVAKALLTGVGATATKSLDANVSKTTGKVQATTDDAITSAVALLGKSLGGLTNAQRFGLTTGALTASDIVGGMAAAVQHLVTSTNATLAQELHNGIDVPVRRAIADSVGASQLWLKTYVDGATKTAAAAAAAHPTAATVPHPAATAPVAPSIAQALSGSLTVQLHLPPGSHVPNPEDIVAVVKGPGGGSADTIHRRGVVSVVQAG